MIPNPGQVNPSTALTVTNGKTYGPGSGQSEVNSPGTDRFIRDEDIERWKPSELENTLGPEQKQAMKTEIQLYRGAPSTADPQDFSGNLARTMGSAAGRAAMGVGAIYAMLGITAFAKLMLVKNHPNDPMFLDNYISQFDGLHLAMYGGFMLAAGPFLAKIPGLVSTGEVLKSTPMIGAALLAGAVATAFVGFFTDSDVDRCLDIDGFIATGKSSPDLPSCDKVHAKYSTEQMTLKFAPQLAKLMATGSLVMGSYFVANVTGLMGLLQKMPLPKGAAPNAASIALVVFAFAAWMGADWIVTNAWQVEQNTREYVLAEHTFARDPYGATLRESEAKVLQTWAALKAAHWVDVPKYKEPTCNSSPCPANPPLDFAGSVDRQFALQEQWRSVQLLGTYSAYQQWSAKVKSYHEDLGASYLLYKEFVDRIEFENNHPGLAPTDPRGFNKTIVGTLSDLHGFAGLNVMSPWKYVSTPNFADYVVASMACGPEAYGQRQTTSWMENAGTFISTWVTHDTSPQQVIKNPKGKAVEFNPPRIVRTQEGTNRSVCESLTGGFRPENFVVEAPWFSSDKSYSDLFGYIKDNVSNAILFDGQNNFDEWWSLNVGVPTLLTEMNLRTEYVGLLKTTYTTALNRGDYYGGWCSEVGLNGVSFARYWVKLGSENASHCNRWNYHRLALGLTDNLRDQLRLYLAMVADVYVDSFASQEGNGKAAESAVLAASQEVLAAFDKIVAQASVTDDRARIDFSALSAAATAKFQRLRDVVFPVYDDKQERTPPQKIIEALLNERIHPLFSETQTFFTILETFELQLPAKNNSAPTPITGG